MNTHTTQNMDSTPPPQEQQAPEVRHRVPEVDIYAKDGTVVLIADMPGVTGSGVDLQIEANKLSLTGSTGGTEEQPLPTEYYRKFTLAHDVDRDAITATMNHGALRVELPRRERTARKKIDVTTV